MTKIPICIYYQIFVNLKSCLVKQKVSKRKKWIEKYLNFIKSIDIKAIICTKKIHKSCWLYESSFIQRKKYLKI